MATIDNFNLGGLNLYINPLIHAFQAQALQEDGQLIRAVNVDSIPYGAKVKRPGYTTYLGAPDTGSVYSLFSWMKDSGTQFFNYRASGGTLYYSKQGTGAWTICGNGTITAGSQVGHAVLNSTLVISQNNGTTRTSTDGTSFTDAPASPAGGYLEQFHNKVYLAGTSNVISASVTGDPTNWSTTGTSDGITVTIPGEGYPNKLFKLADRLLISKTNSRYLYRWDGYNLYDMSSNMGLSSPYSYASVEGNGFWINHLGVMTSGGDQPQLISNPIRRYFYNETGSAIAGTSFLAAPAIIHIYDYLAAVGSMTDDFTYETVPNAIIKYNFQKNEFLNWSFNDFPTAMDSYTDANGSQQMVFGNASGQCFQFGGTAQSDNGVPIESVMEFIYNFNAPHLQKEWRNFWAFFNPGCEAQIMYATGDTFLKEDKKWIPMGDAKSGVVSYKFQVPRSRILYIKIIDSSRNAKFNYYGCAISADIVPEP